MQVKVIKSNSEVWYSVGEVYEISDTPIYAHHYEVKNPPSYLDDEYHYYLNERDFIKIDRELKLKRILR